MNQNSLDPYIDYINRELFKSKFVVNRSYSSPKVTFINKLYKLNYWFPADASSNHYNEEIEWLEKSWDEIIAEYMGAPVYRPIRFDASKINLRNSTTVHTTYSSVETDFIDSLKVFVLSSYNINLETFAKSNTFNTFLILLNELIRKQPTGMRIPRRYELWHYLQHIVWHRTHISSSETYLKYYYDYSPHKTVSRILKFNFMTVDSWFSDVAWTYVYRKYTSILFRYIKEERFEEEIPKFYTTEAGRKAWIKRQMQELQYNLTSFTLLGDMFNSDFFFRADQSIPALEKIKTLVPEFNKPYFNFCLIYWLVTKSVFNSNITASSLYFSQSYSFYQYSFISKRRNLKEFFSSHTPKYAQAMFGELIRWHGTMRVFKNNINLFRPTYWNLRTGLNKIPHEHWPWEDVVWWGDDIPLGFSRFNKQRRKDRFGLRLKLDVGDSLWFYKSWFHEEIFTEFAASYYRTHFNADWLLRKWRMHTNYKEHRKGHYDPKWRERLHEFALYYYMNLFHPSTKRYYRHYSRHPRYIKKTESFIMLNFAWKFNKTNAFIQGAHRLGPPDTFTSSKDLIDPVYSMKPKFKSIDASINPHIFFPALVDLRGLTSDSFIEYQKSMVFLLNVFSKFDNLAPAYSNYLSFFVLYLKERHNINVDIGRFNNLGSSVTYKELSNVLMEYYDFSESDLLHSYERVFAEYTAFQRFYSLMVSEVSNS